MEISNPSHPKARTLDLLVEQVGDETIVYDGARQVAHALNRSASFVWRQSDGSRSVPELAASLGVELKIPPNDSLVEYALDELASANLLEGNRVSRRGALRRITYAASVAVALPVVLSIIAPTPAMAASGVVSPTPTPTNR
jgi:hypothetical protein